MFFNIKISPASSTKYKAHLKAFIIVFLSYSLVSLLSCIPMLGSYLPIDYDISMMTSYLATPQHLGAWRILGIAFSKCVLMLPTVLISLAIVVIHGLASVVLFVGISRIWGKPVVAYVLGLLFVAYPWGYGLMTLAAQTQVFADLIVFMTYMTIYVTIRQNEKPLTYLLLVALFFGSLCAILVQDRLAFCHLALGAWAFFDICIRYRIKQQNPTFKELIFCGLPAFSLFVYILLYKLIPAAHLVSPSFRPQALLSSFFYQYSHYHSFVPWINTDALQFAFSHWTLLYTWIAIILAVPTVLLAYRNIVYLQDQESEPLRYPWLLCLFLLGGCVFVYAVGGGYSLEIYKKYSFVALILAFLAGFVSTNIFRLKFMNVIVLFIMMFFVATAWIHVIYWKVDVERLYALADVVSENGYDKNKLIVSYNTDTRNLWGELSILSESMRPGHKYFENLDGLLTYYHPNYKVTVTEPVSLHYSDDGQWHLIKK